MFLLMPGSISQFNPRGRQRQMGAARACLDLEAGNFNRKCSSNYAYTLEIQHGSPGKLWFPIGISTLPRGSHNLLRLHDAGAQLGFGEDMSQRVKRTTNLGPQKRGKHKTADDMTGNWSTWPVEAGSLVIFGSCFRTQLVLDVIFGMNYSNEIHRDEVNYGWPTCIEVVKHGPKVREASQGSCKSEPQRHTFMQTRMSKGEYF